MTDPNLPKLSLPDRLERPLGRLAHGLAGRGGTAAGRSSAHGATGRGAPGRGGTAGNVNAAERSKPFEWLVRTGFLARGLTYGVIGALALALAFGAGTAGTRPDQRGALTLVARAPLGFVALIVIAVGLLAYATWKLSQAIRGRGPEGGGGSSLGERAINAGGAVVYLLFCALAVEILAGSGGSSGAPQQAAGGVLAWPAGRWIVGAAGLGLIAGAAYQAYHGLSERFTEQDKTEEMRREQLRRFVLLGKVGFVARAVVLALIGYFLLQSAISYDPGNAVGVDGALARLHHQALGPWLVGLVGIGLVVFGAFSIYEARYRRL